MQLLEWGPKEGGIKTLKVLTENSVQYTYVLNIAGGTTDPVYWLFNLIYLSS